MRERAATYILGSEGVVRAVVAGTGEELMARIVGEPPQNGRIATPAVRSTNHKVAMKIASIEPPPITHFA